MTKSTLRRMGTPSQSLSRPASVSTPPQLFHIKAVNCDFTVGVLHNCFTNQEGGLLSPTLCQQENGGEESHLQDLVRFNEYADRWTHNSGGCKDGLSAGLTGKKRKEAASLLWGQFTKSSKDCVNTSFCLRQTLYFMKAFIPFVKQK